MGNEKTCYYCGEEGHEHTECPTYKQCPNCSCSNVRENFDCKVCENSGIVEKGDEE